VGPVWDGGKENEDVLLKNCYLNSLNLCKLHNIKSIAFPCISTGVYDFPKQRAAIIAVHTVSEFLQNNEIPIKVTFVIFDEESHNIYAKLVK
jgi:O-acetyl-ADP-ribose deacetylase (regulator of RNase III)